MKVVIINTFETSGGAAIAANRLMKALNKTGVDAKMLVKEKRSSDSCVYSVNTSWLKRKINFCRFLWERLIIFFATGFDRKVLFQVSIANTGTDISQHPLIKEADIIHLHWINQGFLSFSGIKKLIATGKPIVWTLHDCWIIDNGIYHYPGSRESAKKLMIDLNKSVLKRKNDLGLSKITFVGCSNWIANEARKSALLSGADIFSIPNPIDTDAFRPINKKEARSYLSLSQDKYIFLFAAAKVSDKRKGLSHFINAYHILKKQLSLIEEKVEILIMGNLSHEDIKTYPFSVHTLGYISDKEKLSAVYSSADLFVIPSLEDNLPNTIMESMACGTPCIGFNTGGIPEMIDHKINGYVSQYKDAQDLADGIEWILNHNENHALSEACIKKVHDFYSENVIAKQYIELYKQNTSSL